MLAVLHPAATPAAAARRTDPAAAVRIGLVGCGAFARFSMARYRRLPGVTIRAVADIDPVAADRAAAELAVAAAEVLAA